MTTELKKAWAEHIGVNERDERVIYADECGWPEDFRNFKAGWEAARKAAILAWALVPDGVYDKNIPFIKRVVFNSEVTP